MPEFRVNPAYRPVADQPTALASLAEGIDAARPLPDAARRHRVGQDRHDGLRDRAGPAAGARDRPQQDAGRPALQRVPGVLPGQRRRVLRLVLRLLPAGGLRPGAGPLHREGLLHQRGDRPPSPRGDERAVRAPRRDRGGERLLHLRPRLAAEVQLPGHAADEGRDGRPRPDPAQARRQHVHAQRRHARPRLVPGEGRDARGLPGLRGVGLPRGLLRRRDRADPALRPAHRRGLPGARARRRLAGHPLRDRPRDARGHDRADPRRARGPLQGARGAGQAARVASPAPAHAVRHGDAARARLLQRHRELLALPRRAPAGRAALLPARLLPRRLRLLRRRVAPDRPADRRDVRGRPLAQADARRIWLPAAERPRQPAADVRRVPRAHAADRLRLSHAVRLRAQPLLADRGADRAPDRRGRPRGRRPRDEKPDRRPDGGDPQARRGRGAHARHDAHEEDGGGPHRLPARVRLPRPLPAFRDRHARAHPDHPRAAPRASSTSSSASTCCAKASTCRRSPSSRSSTPTRRASSAARRR